jgi:hypothetical protein
LTPWTKVPRTEKVLHPPRLRGWSPRRSGNLALLLLSGLLVDCGGGTNTGDVASSEKSTPPAVTVSITPTSANVVTGSGSVAFSAAVRNASESTVSWQVGGVAGGNHTIGTISASGVYSAPVNLPVPATVTVTAVASADPTKTASASVSITQGPASLPSVPSALAASNITTGSVTLTWRASTDPGSSVAGYDVYRNGAIIATVTTGTSYTDSPLAASTAYSYQVAAFDKATPPDVSARSPAVVVTTLAVGVGTGTTLTLTPAHAALTLLQTQQFTTNAATGTILKWSVDGVAGGSSALGTISAAGLYTPPASAGVHTVSAVSSTNASLTGTAALAVTDLSSVATWHNDLARTGQNLHEYALTPATVASGSFGKRWSCALDGTVYAQPLYVAGVSIGGGIHNVLYVVTMHDTVYAFDADSADCSTFWKLSLISPSAGSGITTQPNIPGCADTSLEYGINGTPVIDPNSQTLYLVAATTENGTNVQRLHALNLVSGAEQADSPVMIQASVPGNGDGGITVSFNPQYENQRAGLVLAGGGVMIGWGSHCDSTVAPYHGWMMRYDATSLTQTAVYNDTPNGIMGGIWMSGAAPAVDSGGNMFLSTGNGTFDDTSGAPPATALAPNNDFGESFLNLDATTLVLTDFYTPSMYLDWSNRDLDISSGDVMVLPDTTGPASHPNVMVGADKQGHLWMIDRTNMTGYVPGMDNTVQYLTLPNADIYAIHSGLSYWNGSIYVSESMGPLLALQLTNGLVPSAGAVAIAASQSTETYTYPNPTPAISASPAGGAVVWVLDNNANGTDDGSTALGPAILRAYDATDLASTLYSSSTLSADTCGNAAKFAIPAVANGHAYIAGNGVLTVYGLAP